jgi:hypothetical protein
MNLLLRTKLLALSGVLALGGLSSAAAPAAVHAGNPPQAFAFGGPQEVAVVGAGFTPGATLQLEVLNPQIPPSGEPAQVLNIPETRFLTASACGDISAPPNQTCGGTAPARLVVPDYAGPVEVLIEQCSADCGDAAAPLVGPIVAQASGSNSAEVQVLPAAQIQAGASNVGNAGSCSIAVTGSGFGTLQQNVRVFVTPPGANPDAQGNALAPLETVQSGPTGTIGILMAFSPAFVAPGTNVTVLPSLVGQPVSTTLNACSGPSTGPGRISIGSGTRAGIATSPTAPGTGTGGAGGGLAPRVHAAE